MVALSAARTAIESATDIRAAAIGADGITALVHKLESSATSLTARVATANSAVSAEKVRLEEVARAEAARVAAEEAARAAAEQAALEAAEQAAREAEAGQNSSNNTSTKTTPTTTKTTPTTTKTTPTTTKTTTSSRPGNAAPCRRYAPGGKSFIYIDCVTKQPI